MNLGPVLQGISGVCCSFFVSTNCEWSCVPWICLLLCKGEGHYSHCLSACDTGNQPGHGISGPIFFFFFSRQGFSFSSGCPRTHSVDQAGLKLRNLPASASQVLGLKVCATTARLSGPILTTISTLYICNSELSPKESHQKGRAY